MSHLTNIKNMKDVLRENDLPIEHFAYRVTKDQGNEIFLELELVHSKLTYAVVSSRPDWMTPMCWRPGWESIHGAMYDGIRILVVEA